MRSKNTNEKICEINQTFTQVKWNWLNFVYTIESVFPVATGNAYSIFSIYFNTLKRKNTHLFSFIDTWYLIETWHRYIACSYTQQIPVNVEIFQKVQKYFVMFRFQCPYFLFSMFSFLIFRLLFLSVSIFNGSWK